MIAQLETGQYVTLPNDDRTLNRTEFEIPVRSLLKTRETGATICAFYHSHPQGSTYLSARDRESMTADNEPTWPGVDWIVVAVRDGHVTGAAQYTWSQEDDRFRRTLEHRDAC
jgi:proteasome lid subunit RPN8/RPN11